LSALTSHDPHPIPPPFRGREEQAARALLRVEARAYRLLHLPLKGT
jgi:hypothetical protein